MKIDEYKYRGLTLNEVFVDNGEIRLVVDGGSIKIGDMEELYSQKPYRDGTYTDENGIVIHLESFIDEYIAITDTMAKNIKRAKASKQSDDAIFTERLHRFHGILFNRLRGEIKKSTRSEKNEKTK
jgi:hypothetical protein